MKSVAAALTILVLSSPLAVAYQVPATPFSQGSATMPGSGLTQTLGATGRTMLGVATTAGSRGLTAATYSPDLASDTPSQEILVRTGDCASTGPCADRGTMTIAFSQPVRDPILHVAGIGGVSSDSAGGHIRRQSELHSILKLATPGVTLSKASTGNNLAVTGDTITAIDDDTGPVCPTSSTGSGPPAKASASCGSVRVNGTVTSLTFTISAVLTKNAVLPAFNASTSGDAVSIVASVREDFGDAPASYDAGDAARAVIGTVQLGAGVSEDNKDVANGTKSPNASGDSDDDGVTLTPLPTTATSYSTTATVSGVTKPGRVCGWIDFDKSGVFESGERACASVGAAETSAPLEWTGLRGLAAGSTHARFRVGYQAAQVQSPTGASDSGEVEDHPFTITQPEPPKATPDTASTPQDVSVRIDPLSNDTAGTGSTLDPSSVCFVVGTTCVKTHTVPGEGSYAVKADGTVTFDPLPSFTGAASKVTYRVADSSGQTAASTITITVTPVKPEAIDDIGNTAYDTPVTTAVLSNDKPGHPSAPLVPSSVCLVDGSTCLKTRTVAGEGSYSVGPGDVNFDPVPGFVGKTTPVTYRVADDNGATDTATLTITVALPPPPTATPDTGTTPQNVDVTVNPLTNDTAGTGSTLDPSSVCFVVGSTCVKTHAIPGTGGYTVKPDGTVTFDPAPAFVGPAGPVTYRVADSTGQTATSTITITVTPVTPQAVDDSVTTPFDTPVTIPVLKNDKPGSPDAPLVPSSVRLVDPLSGTLVVTLTVPGEGTYAASPDGTVKFTPVKGFTGTANPVTYHVADSNGTPARAKIAITVEKPEPPVANPDTNTTPQGIPVTTAVLANDIPGPTGSPLQPGSVRLTDPATGQPVTTLTVPNQGSYTVDLGVGAVRFEPVPKFTGGASPIEYRVADGNGVTASSTVTITVTPVTPVAEDDAANAAYDTSVKLPVLDNDRPGDPSVPLVPGSVKLIDPSTGQPVTTVTVPDEGTYKVNPDGKVEFDPLPAFTGTATPLTYQVLDTNGTPARATITVTVVKPPPPDAKPDTGTTLQDIGITVKPLANDAAGAGTTLDPASVCLVSGGTCVKTLTVPRQGTYTVAADGIVGFDPLPAFTGAATPVGYRVADALGQTATSTITITVTPITPLPFDDASSTPFNTTVTVPVLTNDKPGDPSAPLDPSTVCVVSGSTCVKTLTVPDQGTYQVLPNGSVTFDPADGFRGVATPVTYRVADDNGSTGDATLTITVGDAPGAEPDTRTTKQDVTVTVDPLANDEPGTGGTLDPKSVEIFDPGTKSWGKTVTAPGEGTYAVRPDGSITFDPLPAFIGQSSVPYRVTDSFGNTAASTLTITVVRIVPQALDDTGTTAYNTPVTVPVARNDKPGDPSAPLDPSSVCIVSGNTCLKTLTVLREGAFAVLPDGSVRFVPVDGFSGTTTPVSYRIADVRGTAARARLTITVGGPEGATAEPDRASGKPGKPVVLHPLANDKPSKGAKWNPDTLCLIATQRSCVTDVVVLEVGRWTVGKDGTIRFTSEPDFRGTATIPYRVTDTYGVTVHSELQVTITVEPAPPGDDELPETGGPLLVLLVAGVLLIGMGGALVAVTRHR